MTPSTRARTRALPTPRPPALEAAASISTTPDTPPSPRPSTPTDVATRVYLGDFLIGTAPGAVRVLRGAEPVTLRFLADGYATAEMRVIPNVDQTLSLSPRRLAPYTPAAAKRSKEPDPSLSIFESR